MSFVTVDPSALTAAAVKVRQIVNGLVKDTDDAAGPTIYLKPPALDEVSCKAAKRFTAHAAAYQAIIGEASIICGEFIGALKADAATYADVEVNNTKNVSL